MMKPFKPVVVTFTFALCLGGCVTPSSNPAPSELEDQFETFLDWFPGRYDSAAQIKTYQTDGTPRAEQNYRRHSIFRRVDLPVFGETVFLAHQYRDGDPDKVYRQRLYTFRLDEQRNVFSLRVHVPKDSSALNGAYSNPDRLKTLIQDDFTVWGGCDLYWRFKEDRFIGRLEEDACRFKSDAFGQEIVLEETLTLSSDRITFADRGLSLSGDYLFGMRGDTPNMSMKVRPFLCQLGDETAWLHDQGGTARLGPYELSLERWVQTADGLSAGLTLSVISDGDIQTQSMRPEDADRINITVTDQTVTCRHAPKTLYSERRI